MRSRTPKSNPRSATVFDPDFLRRLGEEDQPPNVEAEAAGPWEVSPVADGWACTAAGAEEPRLVAREPHVALLAAVALPAAARSPRFTLGEVVARPFPLLDSCRPAGSLAVFDPDLVAAMNVLGAVAASPVALALLLKVAGADAVERAGRLMAADLEAGGPGWGGGR
jgi:hypothetical protein